jgi:hypothetical protein
MDSKYAFLFIVFFCFAAMVGLFYSVDGDLGLSMVVVPFVVILAVIYILFAPGSDSFLSTVMLVSLAAKLLSAWIYTTLEAYKLADVHLYFDTAQQIVGTSTSFGQLFVQPVWGTNLIVSIAACVFAVIGPSLAGAVVLFTMVSFCGQLLFYRAFVLAFPTADRRMGALLLFLCPSIVFWTSTLGKDALMLLAIGLVAYGVARRFDLRGWASVLVGLSAASLIRPHIGAVLAISLFATFLLADVSFTRRIIGLKYLLFPVFLATCIGIVSYSRVSLQLNTLEDAENMSEHSYTYNRIGGSAFGEGESVEVRLAQAPLLMFRPFPWEANNATAALACGESLLLLLFVLRRRAGLVRLMLRARSVPLVVFSVCFFAILSIVLSISISNFGLLARQRVMLLPLVLMLLVTAKPMAARRRADLRLGRGIAWNAMESRSC